MINQYVFDNILGVPERVGYVKQAPPPPSNLAEENPHANFVCDIMREKTNSDIALWHHSGVRNFFHEGEIDSRDVKDMAPFLDYVVVADVPENVIVDAFKKAIKTTYDSPVLKPGLLAVSGLNYTVNPDEGTLTEMNFIDKNGVFITNTDEKNFLLARLCRNMWLWVADRLLITRGRPKKLQFSSRAHTNNRYKK